MSFETNIAQLPAQPSYWWPLDDAAGSSGSTERQSGNNGTPEDGTVTFGVADTPAECTITSSASFGAAYLATTDNLASPSSAYTKAIWLKTTASGCQGIWCFVNQQTGVPGGGRDFYTWQGTDNLIYCGIWNGSYYTLNAPAINDGKWHHVLDTFDGSTMSLYVDFAHVASEAASVESFSGYWRVCGSGAQSGWPALNSGADNPYTGEACHAMIWMGTALTEAEVTQLGIFAYPNWIGEAGWL
jgi:hypothetical protein